MKNKSLQFFFQINAVKSFAQTLRRYTGLNHLAQVIRIKITNGKVTVDELKNILWCSFFKAARAVLQNPEQVNQMLNDLNKVDFANLQEQVRNLKLAFVWPKHILMFEALEKNHFYFAIFPHFRSNVIVENLSHFCKLFLTYYYIGTLRTPFSILNKFHSFLFAL